jgi:hypothetical protein
MHQTEEEYQQEELRRAEQASADVSSPYLAKFKSFLAIQGENTNKTTKELYREHIPRSVFGISSDELADELGVSENELMQKLNTGISMQTRRKHDSSRLHFSKKSTIDQPNYFQFSLITPITRREIVIKCYGMITYGEDLILIGQREFEHKTDNRIYGFKLDNYNFMRYIATAQRW